MCLCAGKSSEATVSKSVCQPVIVTRVRVPLSSRETWATYYKQLAQRKTVSGFHLQISLAERLSLDRDQ
jgi:hypothetical protein